MEVVYGTLRRPRRCFTTTGLHQLRRNCTVKEPRGRLWQPLSNSATSATSPIVPLSYSLSWRRWPSSEELERIDLLLFLLGRYPAVPLTAEKASTKRGSGRQAKQRRLAQLQASSRPISLAVFSSSSAATAAAALGRGDVPAHEIGPATPHATVELLAKRWLHQEAKAGASSSEAATAAMETEKQLLTHPPHFFTDEEAILHRFGMGAFVSPTSRGFEGLFRQRWQDFYVTEMVMETTEAGAGTGIGGRQLSRQPCFEVPRPPSWMTERRDHEEVVTAAEGRDPHLSQRLSAGAVDHSAASFFSVDVNQRVKELQQQQDVSLEDRQAVRAMLQEQSKDGKVAALASPAADFQRNERSGAAVPHSAGKQQSSSVETCNVPKGTCATAEGSGDPAGFFLQCTLHKQHMAHSTALSAIAQTLRIHPRAISVSGIKDFIGDTVQRVRLHNVAPIAALEANRRFHSKQLRMTLSDFSYETSPLLPGDLFGNHFRVVLRDVDIPPADLAAAMEAFQLHGFPNYYGCQRFSWFAGRQDAAFALLRHNWLAFAFLFLNYTSRDRSLRELLQRELKYPHPVQDEYRRNAVRRLRRIHIEPSDLDEAPFLSCPELNSPLTHADGRPFSIKEELICQQLREAFLDLHGPTRRLTAQRLSSYLWNQVLTLRLHHLGGSAVLPGDFVAPANIRQLATSVQERKEWHRAFGDTVTAENCHRYTIEDVVHPGFSFDGIALPPNIIGQYYHQVCAKYFLHWDARHSAAGIFDFREPPRPIIRKPLALTYNYARASKVLTVRFALERGCYANVALSELMRSSRCLGADRVGLLPLPESLWGDLGDRDPGYVTPVQDIYGGYEDGIGFVQDEAVPPVAAGHELKPWEQDGPLFLPDAADPYRKAHRWGGRHLLRNSERQEAEAEEMKQALFERPLARSLAEGEIDTYAGHTVPLPANVSAKRVARLVLQRRRRYAGSPRALPRFGRMMAATRRSSQRGSSRPAFQALNRNSWNVSW